MCGKASVVAHIAGESDRVDWIGREKGFRSRNQATIPESAFKKRVENRSTFFFSNLPSHVRGGKDGSDVAKLAVATEEEEKGEKLQGLSDPPPSPPLPPPPVL